MKSCTFTNTKKLLPRLGLVKSQSWTGNINRTRLPGEGFTPSENSPTNQPSDKAYPRSTFTGKNVSGSTSTKSSPGHDSYKTALLSETGKNNNSSNTRNARSTSNYSIVSLSSKHDRPRSKSPKLKLVRPNDPLIDLSIDNPSNTNKLPLTKVSILEAFDPLIGGDGDFSSVISKEEVDIRIPRLRSTMLDASIRDGDVPDNDIDEDG